MSLPGRKLRLLLLVKAISKDAAPWKFCVLSTYCTDGLTIRSKDQVFLAWLTKPPAQPPSQSPPKDGPGWCLISPTPGLPELLLSQQLAWLRQGPSLLPIASAWIDPHLRAILRPSITWRPLKSANMAEAIVRPTRD